MSFDYTLVRTWELPAADLLAGPLGTLPLAPVAAVERAQLPAVIRRMRERLDREVPSPAAAGELWTATRILMGLRYNPAEIRVLLRGVRHMRESVTYQEIVDEGRVEGRVEGVQHLLASQATARFGEASAPLRRRLASVTDLAELDRLGRSLLTATSWSDWLAAKARRRA